MASNSIPTDSPRFGVNTSDAGPSFPKVIENFLKPLASLKLTVVLFAMSIFIVFVGTLAQVDKDIWEVVDDYFRVKTRDLFPGEYPWVNPAALFARVDLYVFPRAFFRECPKFAGAFPFPKGWLIGAVMGLNLLAAHGLRFKVQASGNRLALGSFIIALGSAVTALVVLSGSNNEGLQDVSWIDWSELWLLFMAGLSAVWLGMFFGLIKSLSGNETYGVNASTGRWLFGAVTLILGTVLAWLLYQGTPDGSSMRILWLLIKAEFAALVLLPGCILVFKRRGGIVLLHGGVALMMASEFIVGIWAVETQMQIEEGQTVDFAQDIRTLELAVIDRSDPNRDKVVTIPQSMLRKSASNEGPVVAKTKNEEDLLPFDIHVIKYLKNSELRRLRPNEKPVANAGIGLQWTADDIPAGVGTDTDSKIDMSAAYVEFLRKGTSQSLGKYLLSLAVSAQNLPEVLTLDGKTYDLYLRFKRYYKPYSIMLKDVRKEDYQGTETPKDYSSFVHLIDKSRSIDRDDVRIWMNNPLRFAGETFYQSNYHLDPTSGIETTTLSVVKNTGWMIPYVSCMIVLTGMLAQFLNTLVRFLNRMTTASDSAGSRSSGEQQQPVARRDAKQRRNNSTKNSESDKRPVDRSALWTSVVVLLLFGGYVASKAIPPKQRDSEMNLYEFGKLPIVYEGRTKPIDTLARNALVSITSGKQTFLDENGKEQPAIRWLLDVITDSKIAEKHKVFYVENLDVLNLLNLEKRPGFKYSLEEFRAKAEVLDQQLKQIREIPAKNLDQFQMKLRDLDRKIHTFILLQESFMELPPTPTAEEVKNPELMKEREERLAEVLPKFLPVRKKSLSKMQPPLAVPIDFAKDNWETYCIASIQTYIDQDIRHTQASPAALSWKAILHAYANKDVTRFNTEVSNYRSYLQDNASEDFNTTKSTFEAYFNFIEPFYYSAVLYFVAFVITAISWLKWRVPLNSAAFALIGFALILHTAALIGRIYISGRPPVTNLYSSAVFIGWGCVVLGMVLERMFRLGIGNAVASVAGFGTLLIAHFLSHDSDTFVVLQAVLDTQFWLATHVVCITLGYATTILAGLLGLTFVLGGLFSTGIDRDVSKDIGRMIYGTLCFAMIFSFFGTVLGGLWADDSWGRFWGWDPKENGALMIVLWNALVLHARWGGMIKDRGLAVLAIIGDIVVGWSWFGVNQLNKGLHTYGFTDGVMLAYGIVSAVLLAIACAGAFVPPAHWKSANEN